MIEEKLRHEETEYLQNKIRTNSYDEVTTALVKRILAERNANIPIPETEEEAEEKYKNNGKVSLILFLLFSSYVAVLWYSEYSFGKFLLFSLTLIGAVIYTRSLRR